MLAAAGDQLPAAADARALAGRAPTARPAAVRGTVSKSAGGPDEVVADTETAEVPKMAALEEGTREGLQAELDRAVAGQKQAEQEVDQLKQVIAQLQDKMFRQAADQGVGSVSGRIEPPEKSASGADSSIMQGGLEAAGGRRELKTGRREMDLAASRGETVVAALRRWAQAQPEKALYTWLDEQGNAEQVWTYRELVHRANAVGYALHKWGCEPGDRAALMYMPGLEFNAGFWGCLFAGVVAVPVYPVDLRPGSFQESVERFGRIVADCQPRLTLTHAPFITLKQRMSLTHLFSAASWPEGLDFKATDYLEPLECAKGLSEPSPDALAFVQYTSGSTGNPKGVMLSHGNVKDNCDQMRLAYQFTEESIGVQWVPIYHDMGLIGGMITPTICGCRTVAMSPMTFLASPKLWLQTLSSYKATHTAAPNFAYELCLRKIPMDIRASLDLSHMVMLLNASEPVTRGAVADFMAGFRASGVEPRMMTPVYGLAEHVVFVSISHPSEANRGPVLTSFLRSQLSENRRAVAATGSESEGDVACLYSMGKTMAQTMLCISQEDANGRLIPQSEGVVGEICLSSPSSARGYWGKPELSKETFQAKLEGKGDAEFLRTGDLGFLHQGELYLCGRIKDVIIINGRNHYPQDIERVAVASSPSLRGGCSAAFAVDIDNIDHAVLLAEVKGKLTHEECQIAIEAIKSAISSSQQLSCSAVLLLKERTIFKTTSGKIRRRACKQGFLAWCREQQKAAKATTGQTSWTDFIRSGVSGLCKAVLPMPSGVLNVVAHLVNMEEHASAFDLAGCEGAEHTFSLDGPGWDQTSEAPVEQQPQACQINCRSTGSLDPVMLGTRQLPFVQADLLGESPVTKNHMKSCDALVVGAGIVGLCFARDLASEGYNVVVVEKSEGIGGIWRTNDYPGLRLDAPGANYRCLSLAPDWTKHHDADEWYRPTREEIMAYIEQLAVHPLISVVLNCEYLSRSREQGQSSFVVSTSKAEVRARFVLESTGHDHPGNGAPTIPAELDALHAGRADGPGCFHSSQLSPEVFSRVVASDKVVVVGSGKAAIDLLQQLKPGQQTVWAHRGHAAFRPRNTVIADFSQDGRVFRDASLDFISKNRRVYDWPSAALEAGWLISCEGPITAREGKFGNGVVDPEELEWANQFEQLDLRSIDAFEGGVTFRGTSRRPLKEVTVGPGDCIVLCTGQSNPWPGLPKLEPGYVKSLLLMPDSNACNSLVPLVLALEHLRGGTPRYHDILARCLQGIAADSDFTRLTDGRLIGLNIARLTYPNVTARLFPAVSKYNLTSRHEWVEDWYGVDLSVADTLRSWGCQYEAVGSTLQTCDALVVGAGIVGLCFARDLASEGYNVVVVERSQGIGGIWRTNDYPGLRLHQPGANYRCLSLAPDWTKHHDADEWYRPTREEIIGYIKELAAHPLISVVLNCEYLGRREHGQSSFVVSTSKAEVRARFVLESTGCYIGNCGAPRIPRELGELHAGRADGPGCFHSSQLSPEVFSRVVASDKVVVVGSGKAAIDLLQQLKPGQQTVWAHRGHTAFMQRQQQIADFSQDGQLFHDMILDSTSISHRYYDWSSAALEAGWLISCEGPITAREAKFGGGIVDPEELEWANQFEQLDLRSIDAFEGGVTFRGTSRRPLKEVTVGPGDCIVLCTGQSNPWPGLPKLEPGYAKPLAFTVMSATLNAMVPLCLALEHLRGGTPRYHGVLSRCLQGLDADPGFSSLTDLRSIEMMITHTSYRDVIPQFFPITQRTMSGRKTGMATRREWVEDWYGIDLSVADTLQSWGVQLSNEQAMDILDPTSSSDGAGLVALREDAHPKTSQIVVSPSLEAVKAIVQSQVCATVSRQSISADVSLQSVGLTSLKTADLAGSLRAELGMAISTSMIYEYPTIASLASMLSEQADMRDKVHSALTFDMTFVLSVLCMQGSPSQWDVFCQQLQDPTFVFATQTGEVIKCDQATAANYSSLYKPMCDILRQASEQPWRTTTVEQDSQVSHSMKPDVLGRLGITNDVSQTLRYLFYIAAEYRSFKAQYYGIKCGSTSFVVELFDPLPNELFGLNTNIASSRCLGQCNTGAYLLDQSRATLIKGVQDLPGQHGSSASTYSGVAVVGQACKAGIGTLGCLWRALTCQECWITHAPVQHRALTFRNSSAFSDLRSFGSFIDDRALDGLKDAHGTEMDPHVLMLFDVIFEAVADAGWNCAALNERKSLCLCTAFDVKSFVRVPLASYAVARIVANRLGIDCRYGNIDAACSSGYLALQHGLDQIKTGGCDEAIVGGVRLQLEPQIQNQSENVAISPSGIMRPLDTQADGMVTAEAASAVILQQRTIAGMAQTSLVGWASTCNSTQLPVGFCDPTGIAAAAAGALSRAGLEASVVDATHLHAMGNISSDLPELQGIAQALEVDRRQNPPLALAGHKGCIGHSEHVAGLLGLITTCMVAQHRSVPGA